MGRLLRALLAVIALLATVGVVTPPSFAQSGYTGYGVLTDAAGNGLVGATVELTIGSPLGGTPTYQGVATTQDESPSADPGYFEVQGLPPSADYYLSIRLADGRSTVIGPRSIGDAGDEFTDLTLASVPLKGTMLDRTTRKPVSRLTAVLGDAQSATTPPTGPTSSRRSSPASTSCASPTRSASTRSSTR